MSDVRLQEIVTRAVVGRCDRRVVWSHGAAAEGVLSVLGVQVNSANLVVEDRKGEASLRLSVTCDLWCATGEQTRVQRLVCTYSEPATVPVTARVVGETETSAELIRGVRCTRAEVREGQVEVTLEANVALEMTGLARFWIKTYDLLAGESEVTGSDDSVGTSTSDSTSEDALDELATLAGSLDTSEPIPGPAPLIPEERVVWEAKVGTPALARFPQKSPQVSIIQGH